MKASVKVGSCSIYFSGLNATIPCPACGELITDGVEHLCVNGKPVKPKAKHSYAVMEQRAGGTWTVLANGFVRRGIATKVGAGRISTRLMNRTPYAEHLHGWTRATADAGGKEGVRPKMRDCIGCEIEAELARGSIIEAGYLKTLQRLWEERNLPNPLDDKWYRKALVQVNARVKMP